MTRWPHGEAEIEELLSANQLQQITAARPPLLACWTRRTARSIPPPSIVEDDPDSAYVLAYDAARHAGTALLGPQGLRPTSKGGHYALERVLRAQFGSGFRPFGAMRRRRNELEYPDVRDERAGQAEARQAVEDATTLIGASEELLPRLSVF